MELGSSTHWKMYKISFLQLVSQDCLPWRYRVRIALDLALILELIAGDNDSSHRVLTWQSVRIDEHWHAYYKPTIIEMERHDTPKNNVTEYGVILALLITGGKYITIGTQSSFFESSVSENILPGCHPMLEALCYQCHGYDLQPNASQIVEELQALIDMHSAGVCSNVSIPVDDRVDINDSQFWAHPDDLTLPVSIQRELVARFDTSRSSSNDTKNKITEDDAEESTKTLHREKNISSPSNTSESDSSPLIYFVGPINSTQIYSHSESYRHHGLSELTTSSADGTATTLSSGSSVESSTTDIHTNIPHSIDAQRQCKLIDLQPRLYSPIPKSATTQKSQHMKKNHPPGFGLQLPSPQKPILYPPGQPSLSATSHGLVHEQYLHGVSPSKKVTTALHAPPISPTSLRSPKLQLSRSMHNTTALHASQINPTSLCSPKLQLSRSMHHTNEQHNDNMLNMTAEPESSAVMALIKAQERFLVILDRITEQANDPTCMNSSPSSQLTLELASQQLQIFEDTVGPVNVQAAGEYQYVASPDDSYLSYTYASEADEEHK
jgi:hypothetical protein